MRRLSSSVFAFAALLVLPVLAVELVADNEHVRVSVGGIAIASGNIRALTIHTSSNDVDAAALAIGSLRSDPRVGDMVRIDQGGRDGTTLFTGEVVAIEPALATTNGRPVLRALNKLPVRAGDEIIVSGGERRFDGKYLVVGSAHRASAGLPSSRTLLRLTRVDGAIYVLPEVGDDVLVAFERGIEHPYVIGTLWNGKDRPAAAPFCGPGR